MKKKTIKIIYDILILVSLLYIITFILIINHQSIHHWLLGIVILLLLTGMYLHLLYLSHKHSFLKIGVLALMMIAIVEYILVSSQALHLSDYSQSSSYILLQIIALLASINVIIGFYYHGFLNAGNKLKELIEKEMKVDELTREKALLLDKMRVGFAEHEMIYDDLGQAVDYRYIYINKAFEELTGWKSEDVVSKKHSVVYPYLSHERVMTYQKVFEGKDIVEFDNYFPKNDMWYSIRAYRSGDNKFVSIFHDITELKKINQELEYYSFFDPLSGLLNYFGYIRELERKKDKIRHTLSICLNVRHFYQINDFYGIEIGDLVIKQIAENLKELMGKINCENILSHYSGDEFHMMLINCTREEEIDFLAKVEQYKFRIHYVEDFKIQLIKDIGYASYPEDTDDLNKVINLSSIAMKKSAKEDQYMLKYDESMIKSLESNLDLAHKLFEALENDLIFIVFQNIVDVNTNKIIYVEALARWIDKDKGYISPLEFLSVAKDSGMGRLLDEYLIKKALIAYQSLKEKEAYKDAKLTLNMIPSSFLSDKFILILQEITKELNIPCQDVVIEISEHTFVYNLDTCNQYINMYRDAGFLIAIDDFGSEYSALGVLNHIKYDVLKLDGAFTRNMSDYLNLAIIEMVVKIINHAEKTLIAEGIETAENSNIIKELGCIYQQGYYYHKPEKLI